MTPEQRADSLLRAYASVVLPDEVIEDMDRQSLVTKTTVHLDSTGRIDTAATLYDEGVRQCWIKFRDRVAAAKRPRPEPVLTHATSSTVRPTP